MNDLILQNIWEFIANQTKAGNLVPKTALLNELGLENTETLFSIKELKESDLILVETKDGQTFYKANLVLKPHQMSAANYIGISVGLLKKYCELNLDKQKDILLSAINFDKLKEKQKIANYERIKNEKMQKKLANVQQANQDLFDLLNLSEEIISRQKEVSKNSKTFPKQKIHVKRTIEKVEEIVQERLSIEDELVKVIHQELQDLVRILVRD